MNLSSACIYLKHIVFNCVCGTQKKARAALREELQQYGRRFTPHWQARRANHRQQIRPSGCQPILQYPWWVRRERKKEARERKVRKRAGWEEEKNKKKWSEYKHWDGEVAAQHTDAQEDKSWRASVRETLKWDAIFLQWKSLNQMRLVNMVEDVFVLQSWMLSGAFFPPRLFL